MTPIGHSASSIADAQQSRRWEVILPIIAAAVPAAAFKLLGLATPPLAKPGAEAPIWVIVAMASLEVLGITAMAVVILIRYEFIATRLSDCTNGHPPMWRRLTLLFSMAMLLLFDTVVNIAAAFSGGSILLVLAVPAFALYFTFARLTLLGLRPNLKHTRQPRD